jgi:hypothetical protein
VTNRSVSRWIADDIATIVWLRGNKPYLFLVKRVNDVEGSKTWFVKIGGMGFWQAMRV